MWGRWLGIGLRNVAVKQTAFGDQDGALRSYERLVAADDNIRHSTRATEFITPKNEASRAYRDAVLALAEREPVLVADDREVAELLPVLESIERTVALSKTRNPESRPFDINEYRALVNEAAVTAGELRLLTQSIAGLVNDVAGVAGIEDTILEVQTELLDRFFLRMVGFLLLFFVLLLLSRFVWLRMSAGR